MIFFFYFFRNFLARFEYERNSGQNFFSLFLGLSHPVLAKNNAGKRFFNFFNFFAIFFGIFLPESSINGIRDYNFFLSFSASLNPFWIEIMPELTFLIFWIFLLFFSELSCPGRVWTEFWTNFFFSLSAYIIPFWLKIIPKRGFLIFLLFFSEFSCPGWEWMEFGSKFLFSLSQPPSTHFG